MKILLVNPPWRLAADSVYSKTGAIYAPLGLAYIAAYLREHTEVSVEILDASGLNLSFDDYKEHLRKNRYDVVGINAYTPTSRDAFKAAQICKQTRPEALVVLGGPHATLLTEQVLDNPAVDLVVRGEGEITFTEVVEAVAANGPLAEISGISYKENGEVRHNLDRPPIADLDALLFPARDLLPMHIYRPASGAYKRLPVTNIITTRGCPFHCGFCSKAIFGSRVRSASPERVLEEIEALIRTYKVKELYFCDDSFTLNKKRITALCEGIIKRGLDLTWTCSTRVNLVDLPLLRLMRRSGCVSIGYGVESGDERISEMINKGITFAQVREAIKWTRQAGIESRTSYIFGFPGENWETMGKTLNFAKELNSDFAIFNLAIPLPGTEIYELAKEKKMIRYEGKDLYSRCDGAQPLIDLPGISAGELVDFYRRAYKGYYLRPRYILSRLASIRSLNDIRLNVKGLSEFLSWDRG